RRRGGPREREKRAHTPQVRAPQGKEGEGGGPHGEQTPEGPTKRRRGAPTRHNNGEGRRRRRRDERRIRRSRRGSGDGTQVTDSRCNKGSLRRCREATPNP